MFMFEEACKITINKITNKLFTFIENLEVLNTLEKTNSGVRCCKLLYLRGNTITLEG